MHSENQPISNIAFTSTVKAIQQRNGSRQAYARMESGSGWSSNITDEIKSFIEAQTSIFLATNNADGQPYIQHRGGPEGFLQVLDEHTIGFADFAGNRQYITQGNLSDNQKAFLFLIDYRQQQRIKLWGEARMIEDHPALLASLTPAGYKARAERVFLFSVKAWDANCHQHIPIRFDAADVHEALKERDQRIKMLEREIHRLKNI
ncbi:pyridoxamine 5'-phosphate oxidase family protein [Undibacterium sp. Xuan67W]|uniref:pyridoxamine 5'-phosphate oxidase family protein n=1 Tax=Undibacterium sp. Xuan67W TaxID=3413057 RepID=UPI003BF3A54A